MVAGAQRTSKEFSTECSRLGKRHLDLANEKAGLATTERRTEPAPYGLV